MQSLSQFDDRDLGFVALFNGDLQPRRTNYSKTIEPGCGWTRDPGQNLVPTGDVSGPRSLFTINSNGDMLPAS